MIWKMNEMNIDEYKDQGMLYVHCFMLKYIWIFIGIRLPYSDFHQIDQPAHPEQEVLHQNEFPESRGYYQNLQYGSPEMYLGCIHAFSKI